MNAIDPIVRLSLKNRYWKIRTRRTQVLRVKNPRSLEFGAVGAVWYDSTRCVHLRILRYPLERSRSGIEAIFDQKDRQSVIVFGTGEKCTKDLFVL